MRKTQMICPAWKRAKNTTGIFMEINMNCLILFKHTSYVNWCYNKCYFMYKIAEFLCTFATQLRNWNIIQWWSCEIWSSLFWIWDTCVWWRYLPVVKCSIRRPAMFQHKWVHSVAKIFKNVIWVFFNWRIVYIKR